VAEPGFSLPTPAEFLREHLVWVLGLIPFILAAIEVLIATGGDPLVFSYLIQNMGVVTVVLCSILPLIPLAVLLIAIWLIALRYTTPKSDRRDLGNVTLFAVLLGIGSSILTISLVYLLVVIVIAAINIQQSYAMRLRARKDRLRYGADVPSKSKYAPALSTFIASLAMLSIQSLAIPVNGNWIPSEVIQVKGAPKVAGDLLTSDHTWTIYRDFHNQVHIVKTDDVVSRQPCYRDSRLMFKNIGQIITAHSGRTQDIKCVLI
jgi:hypothetical protein